MRLRYRSEKNHISRFLARKVFHATRSFLYDDLRESWIFFLHSWPFLRKKLEIFILTPLKVTFFQRQTKLYGFRFQTANCVIKSETIMSFREVLAKVESNNWVKKMTSGFVSLAVELVHVPMGGGKLKSKHEVHFLVKQRDRSGKECGVGDTWSGKKREGSIGTVETKKLFVCYESFHLFFSFIAYSPFLKVDTRKRPRRSLFLT